MFHVRCEKHKNRCYYIKHILNVSAPILFRYLFDNQLTIVFLSVLIRATSYLLFVLNRFFMQHHNIPLATWLSLFFFFFSRLFQLKDCSRWLCYVETFISSSLRHPEMRMNCANLLLCAEAIFFSSFETLCRRLHFKFAILIRNDW